MTIQHIPIEWINADLSHLKGIDTEKSMSWVWLLVIIALVIIAFYIFTTKQHESYEHKAN